VRRLLIGGFLLALVLAGVVSHYASSSPDGLNKVAEDKGFAATAEDHPLADSPLADYEVRGVDDGRVSGGLAGVLGVVATFAVGGLVFLAVRGRGRGAGSGPDGGPGGGGDGDPDGPEAHAGAGLGAAGSASDAGSGSGDGAGPAGGSSAGEPTRR
jgi:hypothetical protein